MRWNIKWNNISEPRSIRPQSPDPEIKPKRPLIAMGSKELSAGFKSSMCGFTFFKICHAMFANVFLKYLNINLQEISMFYACVLEMRWNIKWNNISEPRSIRPQSPDPEIKPKRPLIAMGTLSLFDPTHPGGWSQQHVVLLRSIFCGQDRSAEACFPAETSSSRFRPDVWNLFKKCLDDGNYLKNPFKWIKVSLFFSDIGNHMQKLQISENVGFKRMWKMKMIDDNKKQCLSTMTKIAEERHIVRVQAERRRTPRKS
ncbi:unnamed protein product [Larinioides sclopetarius]|uniref:LAGLIDADG homing endonuclease n=1 Tax=Larinioides sclopetarius TaxID=280406 RepID=A0AAV2AH76_9ARAC